MQRVHAHIHAFICTGMFGQHVTNNRSTNKRRRRYESPDDYIGDEDTDDLSSSKPPSYCEGGDRPSSIGTCMRSNIHICTHKCIYSYN